MDKLPTLIVSVPKSEPISFELNGDRIGLGREADNQIHVPSKSVSSSHCEFRKKGDKYEIVDLESTNGTRINGKTIEKHTLEDGDRILLGETVPAHFVLLGAGEVAKAAAVIGDESQNAAAAVYTAFDEKLQSIEADIAAKKTEHDEIAAQLAEMHKEFDTKKLEHDELLASMEKLSEEIAAKKSTPGSQAEIDKLENELMAKTRRVQVLATDLEGQAEQMKAMQPGGPAVTAPGRQAGPIRIAAMSPPGAPAPPSPAHGAPATPVAPAAAAAPPAAAAPAPAAAPVAPKPIAIPAAPAPGAPPVGSGTMIIAGAGEGEEPAKKKILVAEPTKPRPKLNLG